MSVALPSSIPLKDDEKALFDVLLAFIASHEHTQHVILRAVGGWIRDKVPLSSSFLKSIFLVDDLTI